MRRVFLTPLFALVAAVMVRSVFAVQPSTPLRLKGDFDIALDGRSVTVRAEILCDEPLGTVRVFLDLPEGDRIVSTVPSGLASAGRERADRLRRTLSSEYSLDASAIREVSFQVAPTAAGDHRVDIRVQYPREGGDVWGDMVSFFYHDDGASIVQGLRDLDPRGASEAVKARPGERAEASLPCRQPAPTALPETSIPLAPPTEGALVVRGRWMMFDQNDGYVPQWEQLAELYNSGGTRLAQAYTDLSGYFTFPSVSNPGSLYVTVRAECYYTRAGGSDHLRVHNDLWSGYDTYYTYTPTFGGVPDGTYDIGEWLLPNGGQHEKAYWALKSVQETWRYLYFVHGDPNIYPGAIRVQWYPGSTDGTYWSSIPWSMVHLADNDPESRDTVVHECGHNVMGNVYGSFPSNDCPSPHYIERIGGDHCGWTEGWGDFLSLAVNGDPVYTWPGGGALNLENPTWGAAGWDNGPQVEGRVAGALWDIIDADNEGDSDFYTDAVTAIWDTFWYQDDSNFCAFWDASRPYSLKRSRDNCLYQNTIDSCDTCVEDPYEDDDTCAQATIEGAPSTYTYEHCTDADFQYIDVGIDYRYTWETDNLGFEGDTTLTLYAGDCATQIGYNDDKYTGNFPRSSKLVWTSDRNARVYIAAREWGGSYGAHHTYDISLSRSCPSPSAADLPSPQDDATVCGSPTLSWTGYGRTYDVALDGSPLCTGIASTTCGTYGLSYGWHYWRITSKNACGGSSASPYYWFYLSPAPASPADSLRVTRTGGNIYLSWSACAYAASYSVKRCLFGGSPCTPVTIVGTPTGATYSEVSDGNGYFYTVEAVNPCGVTP